MLLDTALLPQIKVTANILINRIENALKNIDDLDNYVCSLFFPSFRCADKLTKNSAQIKAHIKLVYEVSFNKRNKS